jgi:hypothetical protein
MVLNPTLASYFTKYKDHVWPHFFNEPPTPSVASPQPLFVKQGGVELPTIGKHYATLTMKHLNKRLTVSIVRKVRCFSSLITSSFRIYFFCMLLL